jgi:hypothetical protein
MLFFECGVFVILSDMYFRVLCLIVVPMPPGKNTFAVQLNNNNKKMILYAVKFIYGQISQEYSDAVERRPMGPIVQPY